MFIKQLSRTALVGLALTVVAACAESPSSPMLESNEAAFAKGGNRKERSDSGVVAFTLNPNFGLSANLGDHTIYVPAGVICDPFTSNYGPRHWDTPCTVATKPIPMVARWYVKNGNAYVQFLPDLRFAPTTDPSKMAKLTMRQAHGEVSGLSNILWWDREAKTWIDEGALDPTLTPWLEPHGNRVSRRLKHFSGYVIGTFCRAGCEPPQELY